MGQLKENLSELAECGLPAALEAIGERWAFLILRGAFNGLHHFEEFQSTLGIARNILANRLGRLVQNGILARTPLPDDRRKIEYRLTEKGTELLPAMLALRQWGEKWETGCVSDPVLVDELCERRHAGPHRRQRFAMHRQLVVHRPQRGQALDERPARGNHAHAMSARDEPLRKVEDPAFDTADF